MPAKTKTEANGFSAEERAAMKQRAAELRAEEKKGAARADALQAALDSIAAMAPYDRALAERVHATVTSTAPELSPKTWYGMPAYANEDGKVVIFFKDAGKFKSRYARLGFEEAANLDEGPMWPTSYALTEWTPAVEKKVVALLKVAAAVVSGRSTGAVPCGSPLPRFHVTLPLAARVGSRRRDHASRFEAPAGALESRRAGRSRLGDEIAIVWLARPYGSSGTSSGDPLGLGLAGGEAVPVVE